MERLMNERAANSKRAVLLRMRGAMALKQSRTDVTLGVTGGIGVRSCLDCGDTRCPGNEQPWKKSGIERFPPDVNRHDGQGTASQITADFQNS